MGGTTQQVSNEPPRPQNVEDARKNVYSEAPTRRYDNPPLEAPYPSIFVPPTYTPPPAQYQSRENIYQPPVTAPSSRPIRGIGISEKWASMLPYAPFSIGLVVSLLELFLVPRSEGKVRYHASQGVALHIAILIVQTIFSVISTLRMRERTFTPRRRHVVTTIHRSKLHTRQSSFPRLTLHRRRRINHDKTSTRLRR